MTLAAVTLLMVSVCFCWMQSRLLIPNHDVAWLLELSRRMLNGGKYFADFYEINPPIYPVLLFGVEALSRLAGIAVYSSFLICVSALVYAVSLTVFAQLSPVFEDMSLAGRITFTVGVMAALFFVPGLNFGQRDHVSLLLLLPALCWIASHEDTSPLTPGVVVMGVIAALGFLIKPFLFAVGAAVLGVRVIETRSARVLIEPLSLLIVGATGLYVLTIYFLFPEWLKMVDVARHSYDAYNSPVWVNMRSVAGFAAILLLALLNEWLTDAEPIRRAGRFFAAAALGALCSYIAQHKGWSYHLNPAMLLIGMQGVLTCVGAFRRLFPLIGQRLYPQRAVVSALIFMAPVVFVIHWTWGMAQGFDAFYRYFTGELQRVGAGSRVFFFSTSVTPEFPLNTYARFSPSSRFPCLWTLPDALKRDAENGVDPHSVSEADRQLIKLVAEDFERWSPDVLVVDESAQKQALSGPFEFLPWFGRDPDMQRRLDGYILTSRINWGVGPDGSGGHIYAIYLSRQSHELAARAAGRRH